MIRSALEGPAAAAKRWGCWIFLPFARQTSVMTRVSGHLQLDPFCAGLAGYEIHAGRSMGLLRTSFTALDGGAPDGVLSADGTRSPALICTVCSSTDPPSQAAELAGLAQAQRLDLRCVRERDIRALGRTAWKRNHLGYRVAYCNCVEFLACMNCISGGARRARAGWPSNLLVAKRLAV